MENVFLNAALDYLEYGFYVLPLKPKCKIPLTANGFKNASNDPQQIKEWWKKNPYANIGIATGDISDLLVIVHAENSFGVMLKQPFECHIVFLAHQEIPAYLKIGDQVLIDKKF